MGGALLKCSQLKVAFVSAAQKSFAAVRHALTAKVSSGVIAALAAATAAPEDEAAQNAYAEAEEEAGGVGASLDAAWSAAVKRMMSAFGSSPDVAACGGLVSMRPAERLEIATALERGFDVATGVKCDNKALCGFLLQCMKS